MMHDIIIGIVCWIFGFMIGIQPSISQAASEKVKDFYRKKEGA